MANNPPIPYFQFTRTIDAGEKFILPGQYTWMEILAEVEHSDPSVISQAIQIAFALGGAFSPLFPGITVSIPTGYDSNALVFQNTDTVNSIDITVCFGAGDIPARDQRLVVQAGATLGVVVENTTANRVPVSLDVTQTIPVEVLNPVIIGAVPANAVGIGAQFTLGAGTHVLKPSSGPAQTLLFLFIQLASGDTASLSSNTGVWWDISLPGTYMLPYPIWAEGSQDITLTLTGTASASGSIK